MRQVNEWAAVGAAFLVLFTAMLEPMVSALLAAVFLAALAIHQSRRSKAS